MFYICTVSLSISPMVQAIISATIQCPNVCREALVLCYCTDLESLCEATDMNSENSKQDGSWQSGNGQQMCGDVC